jgi:hypothetical protein
VAALLRAGELSASGERGSVVTLICDVGVRYADTAFSDRWLEQQGLHCTEAVTTVASALESPAEAATLRERVRQASHYRAPSQLATDCSNPPG